MLNVQIYLVTEATLDSPAELSEAQSETVDYVSYFNGNTHGPPALVAPGRENGQGVAPKARPNDVVLYVNTSLVPVVKITRLDD